MAAYPPHEPYPSPQQPPDSVPYPADPLKQPLPEAQQGYIAQGGGNAGYYPSQQQAQAQTVVVQQQPQQPTVVATHQYSDVGTGAMIFAIVMTVMAFIFGCWWALLCTIPGIVFALSAQNAGHRGDIASAKSKENLSFCCTAVSIVLGVIGTIAIIVGGVLAWYFTVGVLIFGNNRLLIG